MLLPLSIVLNYFSTYFVLEHYELLHPIAPGIPKIPCPYDLGQYTKGGYYLRFSLSLCIYFMFYQYIICR